MQKFLKTVLAAAAFVAVGMAHAAVIDFENLPVSPPTAPYFPEFLTHADYFSQNGYDMLGYSTKVGAAQGVDFVGAVISDPATCESVLCPTNNSTNYYGSLNDGGLAFYRSDSGEFKMSGLDASFIATPSTLVPGNSLVLVAFGYNGSTLVYQQNFYLPGPVAGAYSFSSYVFDAANADMLVTEVDIQGYSCVTGSSSCGRASDKAQFALDNVMVSTVTAVPEPAEWLLMGLGLDVVGGVARRRNAAAAAQV